jgi:hypothetical protein
MDKDKAILSRLLPYMEVCHCAGAKQKRKFFQLISFETKAIFFPSQSGVQLFRASSKRLIRCFLDISSFLIGTMPPAVIFYDPYNEVPSYHRPTYDDELPSRGENWDEEVVPGGMQYIGQGQMQFLRIDEVEPGMIWPKRRKKKKKKWTSPPPPPPEPTPAPSPAPIDWEDWEEICQFSPLPASPVPAPPLPVWEPEDWDAEIAASQWEPEEVQPWEPEDWDAEIAASQWEPEDVWQPEDWDAEISASQWEPEDWEAELSQWQPEDWDAELASQ